MIIGFGIFLWTLSLLLAVRLAFLGREHGLTPRFRAWLWIALGLAAVVLLFRPHEDIFGGEDPGSYVNSGITYGRQQKFFEVDPLLFLVSPETRPDFYYGHSGYGTTKDACLWVREPDRAVTGPHFQPAYPLLIALVARIADPSWALFVIPVFTLFLALALRALASLLLPYRLAGLIACLVFLLNPLTLWHGRCARPEIIAGFMFFGGCALLLNAWRNRRWSRWSDLVMGAAAISLAPFFHITAGYLLIPSAIAVAIIILRGRDDFLVYPMIALAGLVLFTWQMKFVTDYYGMSRFLDGLIYRPQLTYSLFAASFALLAAGCWLSRRSRKAMENRDQSSINNPDGQPRQSVAPHQQNNTMLLKWRDTLRRVRGLFKGYSKKTVTPVALFSSLGLALLSTVCILYIAFTRDTEGSLPLLGRPIEHFLYLADFKTFANMVTLSIALLALLGWIVWLTGPVQYRRERIALSMVIFPAVIFSGSIRDFMMTRYWFTALLPMTALCLTALAARLSERVRSTRIVILCVALIILLGAYQRAHLISVTEYRGLTGFLKPYAEIIKRNNGILLCEYSRLAAPLEHFFGIPTLGLDNERKHDYSRAEQAWERIMTQYPDHPAFFMTPFHAPVSDRFDYKLANEGEFRGNTLVQARQSLPTLIGEYKLRTRLYRMSLKTSGQANCDLPSPEQYRLDAGNMGLRHFANVRSESAIFDTLASNPTNVTIVATSLQPSIASATLLINLTNLPYLEIGNITTAGQELPTAQLPCPTQPYKLSFAARWARAGAKILVPPCFPGGYFVLMATTPRLSNGEKMRIVIRLDAEQISDLMPEPDHWQWYLIPMPASAAGQWLALTSEPAWNPRMAGYPEDLGILAGHISFWPTVPKK